ncbi:related to transporter (major facilitator superfamily) [Ramularia collo-cygni]|uniref:Related to transporter (Major facilitator superfamily) n=1 Tax=Ramularia collo-cygni TaxID=112498 RepID=A0A2D3V224_9PEZI|nr:related to transporter (major facilitator superfamily) [Ramularia collo-cygni]CZT15559.1 related to transporter (major facilitator superfamily) [Ramularia collo-cygni]
MSDGEHATETSPLISNAIRSIEPGNGLTPDSANTGAGVTGNGTFNANGTPIDDDPESQGAPGDQVKHQGLPEVKKRMKYIFPAVAIGVFLSAADQTIIVSSYGRIGTELNALNKTSWIATAYFLTLTSCQPLYGKLSDIFGRKVCLLFGYTVFGLGCLWCGLSPNIEHLIAARAFAGIGSGAMTTCFSIILSDVCTLRERGTWQGYINIVYAAGASAGAPLGGIFADYIGWRWSFLIQAPMCLVAFVAVYLVLNLPERENVGGWKKNLKRIDFGGAIFLIAAVFTLLLALDRGSNVSWQAPITLISLGLSIPLFAAFIVVETKVATEPFAPGHIVFNRSIIACYLCNLFAMAGWLATSFYIPLYWQVAKHITATGAGVRMIPAVLMGVSGSLFAGFYMKWTGRFYWLTILSYSGLVVGTVLIFLCSGVLVSSTAGMIVGMCINGFSNGNGITTTLIGIIANASHEDQAIATACSYLFRSLGSVLGVSLSATVANNALRNSLASELPNLGLPEGEALEIADKVRESLAYLRNLEPNVRVVVEACYARSTTAAFSFQIVLVAGAAISAWFIREKSLSR